MKKIFSLLKKSFVYIILVLILLVVQVQLDLRLPEYTSKIINIGIQQNGIEDSVPDVIREKEFDKALIFLSDKDKETVKSNYKLIEKSDKNYLDEYKLLEFENLYILKSITKNERKELDNVISKPLLISFFLTSDGEEIVKMRESMMKDNNIDFSQMLPLMKEEQIKELINQFDKVTSELEPSLLKQINTNIVKSEYIAVGKDINKLQNSYLLSSGAMMVLIALIVMLITIAVTYFSSKIGSRYSRDLRSEVTKKVMSYSNTEIETLGTSSLITRSTNDIQQVQTLIIMMLRFVIYAPLLGLGALNKVINSPISWIIALAVGIILLLVIILLIVAMPKFKMLQKLIDKVNLVFRETLTGLPVIRAFANEKREEKKFDESNTDLTKTNLFVNRVMAIMMPTMMFIMNGVSVLIIWVGSKYVDIGSMQVGSLMAFITYTMQIIMSFLILTMMSIMLPRALVSLKRISEIFNLDSSIKEIEEPLKFKKETKGTVEFKDVYFRYPDAKEDVLESINFHAESGTTTAFIGSTGSGKSTMINLIPRFFDVTGGKILIDGVDIKSVSLKDLRNRLGFVPQKGILFSGTIKSNITFKEDKLSIEELEKYSKIAQANEFIEKMKDKYDSEISQGGTNVSGGQKQRISIARALAKNPDILIFDDSFSALDYKTDKNLRNALKKEFKNKTILIVASRIATVMDADKIVVLDKGNIVGIGTHKELLKENEIYKEIAYSQLSEEELKNA